MNAKWIAWFGAGLVIGGLFGAGVGLGYYGPAAGVVMAAAIGVLIGVVVFRSRRRAARS